MGDVAAITSPIQNCNRRQAGHEPRVQADSGDRTANSDCGNNGNLKSAVQNMYPGQGDRFFDWSPRFPMKCIKSHRTPTQRCLQTYLGLSAYEYSPDAPHWHWLVC